MLLTDIHPGAVVQTAAECRDVALLLRQAVQPGQAPEPEAEQEAEAADEPADEGGRALSQARL